MEQYLGTLNINKMNEPYKSGYKSFYGQIDRCHNKNSKYYFKNGDRGIKVTYTVREFMYWWASEYAKKSYWSCPTVSRIDHNSHYCFENIKLEEKSVNTTERNKRIRNSSLKKIIIAEKSDQSFTIFGSVAYASEYLKIPRRSLLDLLQQRYGHSNHAGLTFSYCEVN